MVRVAIVQFIIHAILGMIRVTALETIKTATKAIHNRAIDAMSMMRESKALRGLRWETIEVALIAWRDSTFAIAVGLQKSDHHLPILRVRTSTRLLKLFSG